MGAHKEHILELSCSKVDAPYNLCECWRIRKTIMN